MTESKSRNLMSIHIWVTLRVERHMALGAGDWMRKDKQGPHSRVPPRPPHHPLSPALASIEYSVRS